MKRTALLLMAFYPIIVFTQSQFSVEDYSNFREQNKSFTTTDLLEQNPHESTYYISRKYEPELTEISWFDSIDNQFHFTSDEEALLRKNFFMVSERLSSESWLDGFIQVYNNDLPLFLSTDFILFTLHQSYDEVLKKLESEILEPGLIELVDAMYVEYLNAYEKYKHIQEFLPSLADVDLYIAIAKSLLSEEEVHPQFVDTLKYREILDGIESEQIAYLALFTSEDLLRKLDFSQFKPRGHYTDEIYTSSGIKTLEKYFQAMMWMGRIDFLMTAPPENPWEVPWTDSDLLRMNLSALILNEVLHSCGKLNLLERHEAIIGFLIGESDNLTPKELDELSESQFDSIQELLEQNEFDQFTALLNSSDDYGQKIMSNFFMVDPDAVDPGKLPISFKLLGQKFLIDSYVFSEVVFDRIVFNEEKQYRMMPDPLDILSAFGNENAMELLYDELENYHYAYKISELNYLINSYDDEFWTQSLYNTWLLSILQLNPSAKNTEMPYFMQTSAWHHEKLNTQLTSWAQLRHDNILYGKQSYTGGTGCSYPYTYVEPYPEFYEVLESFSSSAAIFFGEQLSPSHPALSADLVAFYSKYSELMEQLKEISRKELAGEFLTESEIIFLKTMINDYMASGPSVNGWITELLYPSMNQWDIDFSVADVHTQPTEPGGAVVGKVLHVGNGLVNMASVIAPSNVASSRLMCFAGPVSSFHTEISENFYRYNDDEWEEKFLSGEAPQRPAWVYAYLANNNGDSILPDKVLKGVEYPYALNIPGEEISLAYLLIYPNPVDEYLSLRFLLNANSDIQISLYDLSGRLLTKDYYGELPSAEHNITLELVNQKAGIYILRMDLNGRPYYQQFVKR